MKIVGFCYTFNQQKRKQKENKFYLFCAERVGIARALASNAKILLMDEPFGAVDEITRKLLQDEILRIYKQFNMTIIFITHDIKEALKLGTRVIVMDKGEIVQNDTPEEVVRNPKTSFVRNLIGA